MTRTWLALLALCAAAVAQTAPPAAGLDPERIARIAPRMQWFVDRGEAAGIVTLIARHGKVAHLNAAGYQNLETKAAMKTDSIFQVMSMTKPVTAVGIMILAEQGKLSVTDPVERHLPEFKGQMVIDSKAGNEVKLKKPARPITIRDLMTHTSGMPQMPPAGAAKIYTSMNLTLAEAVTLFSQQPLEFEPGTKWLYSNPGIATLGRIIEMVSDQPFETFIANEIFKPLGMKDSFFFPPPDKTGRIALLYRSSNGKLERAGPDALGGDSALFRRGAKFPAPEFGLYSTAADLAAFYQMMLNGGIYNGHRILSPDSVRVMSAVHTGDIPKSAWSPGAAYGLAWEVVKEPLGAGTLMSIGAYGHGGAFGTQGWIDPKKDLVGVFLVQLTSSADSIKQAFVTMANAAVD